MRVLLIGDFPPPMGGVSVHVQRLHSLLRRRGLSVGGVDIGQGKVPGPGIRKARTPSALIAALAREPVAVSHLHTSGNNARAFQVAAAVGMMRGAGKGPLMATLHSGLLPGFLAASRSNRLLARVALAPYVQLIAVSEAVAGALHGAGLPASRIAVREAFLSEGLEEVRAQATRRPEPGPVLAFAHHPSPVYGRTLFFEALAQLSGKHPQVRARVHGPGTGSDAFREDVARFGLEGRLQILGEVSQERALASVATADLFVRPTFADGDAISVREALALGVRCVASDAAQRPRGVVTHRTGDVTSLVAAINGALAAPPPAPDTGSDVGAFLFDRYRALWEAHVAVGGRSHPSPERERIDASQ
ncbi:MAG TPA: glycosyltransferase family 4 protein [Myxococcaceae bacterium]|nr:glycosyltransferase family 4 protein [Myxococcaceae bacterium]